MRILKSCCNPITLLLIFMVFSQPLFGSEFYDDAVINTLQLTFSDDNWDADLDAIYKQDYDGDGEYDRLSCTAVINGVQYDQVGVRYKGNSSYSANNAKNPFNIKLDYILEQDYEGYGTLKLSNVYKDPSFVRETLSYEIARKYMAASQANYIKVYIYNHAAGQYNYHGLYTNVEAIDKTFFAKHFYSNDNARFKCNGTETWSPNSSSTGSSIDYLGSDPSLYYDLYQLKSDDPNHWDSLVDLAYGLKYNSQDVEDLVDLDRAIWMLAFNNVLVNLDSYTGPSRQNYYLYRNNDDRWATVLWDLNESFGAFSMIDSDSGMAPSRPGDPGSSTSLEDMDPLLREGDDDWPLLYVILGDSTYRKMYIAHMRTILEENFENGWYETRASELQDIIASDVQADSNKFYSYYDFTYNINYTRQEVIGIAQLMEDRVSYLDSHSSFTAAAPVISNIVLSTEEPSANSTVWVTADVSNASSVLLAYRYASTGKFTNVQMTDDGTENDGSAGDGTYGVLLPIANTNVEYYLYAENANAAVFSPERAEYEFYTIDVSATSLVINEFMAENDTTIQDNGGGYPDWLELYNPGPNAVDLGGMYLTDNLSEPTQWRIPDGVTIEPDGHLLIWADNDEDQGDTHANFKLSRSGEEIGLYDTDANGNVLIDSIVFSSQTADVSYGRVGDGDDNWQEIYCPSPGSANRSVADLDGNCIVDLADFALFGSYWQNSDYDDFQGADLTDDGDVDLDDLWEFCADWLK